nr:atp-dependent rna helicase mrh4, mitochondrial [Quercus suber]
MQKRYGQRMAEGVADCCGWWENRWKAGDGRVKRLVKADFVSPLLCARRESLLLSINLRKRSPAVAQQPLRPMPCLPSVEPERYGTLKKIYSLLIMGIRIYCSILEFISFHERYDCCIKLSRAHLMLRTICPFCEVAALLRPQSQSQRWASTLQKRRPSRMTLSANVRRGPSTRPKAFGLEIGDGAVSSQKPVRRSRNSPFGGMNLTEVPRDLQRIRHRASPAETRRVERNAKGQYKTDKKVKDPMKALKMQRALSNVSYERRGKVKEELLGREHFDEFELLDVVKQSIPTQALGGVFEPSPTPIQKLALPALLGMQDGRRRRKRKNDMETSPAKKQMEQFLLAAETGSGKTLAYVLPIIDSIKRAEVMEAEEAAEQARIQAEEDTKRNQTRMFELDPPPINDVHPSTARPRAIILLPTAELVAQVGTLVKAMSHTVKYRSAMISTAYTSTVIKSRVFSSKGIDILISTPHLLSSIRETEPNILSRVSHLVVDEADSLLDRSFSPITSEIIDRATPSLEQLILCSATIPRSLDSYLHKRYPDIKRLVTPNLHAIPRRVQLSVIDIEKVPYQGNRNLACAQTIWNIGKGDDDGPDAASPSSERKIVVFVNEREKAAELTTYLRSKGIDATALSRDSDERKQAETLAAFTGMALPVPKGASAGVLAPQSDKFNPSDPFARAFTPRSQYISRAAPPAVRQLHNTRVLVTTDLGSRGIDTLLVKTVVLYDVPHTSIDFIHRLGRVGRMGRRGRGYVLVGRHDRKDVVKEVRDGMFRGAALI